MKIDNSIYKILTWKHPVMIHWIINPALAFNEIILGQRIPKLSLIEKNSTKSISEKTYIPCPHCSTFHSSLKWSTRNGTAFKNWFGLYCDNCNQIIPCLTNLTSYLIMGLTFPIWFWFKDRWKETWVNEQKIRFSKPMNLTPPPKKWWKVGLVWGFFMYLAMTIFIPILQKKSITQDTLLISIPIWIVGGLLYGFSMKKFNNRTYN